MQVWLILGHNCQIPKSAVIIPFHQLRELIIWNAHTNPRTKAKDQVKARAEDVAKSASSLFMTWPLCQEEKSLIIPTVKSVGGGIMLASQRLATVDSVPCFQVTGCIKGLKANTDACETSDFEKKSWQMVFSSFWLRAYRNNLGHPNWPTTGNVRQWGKTCGFKRTLRSVEVKTLTGGVKGADA